MTIQQTPQADLFKQQLRDSLQRETADARPITITRHSNVYTCGDRDNMVYFVESGQVKLLIVTASLRSGAMKQIASSKPFCRRNKGMTSPSTMRVNSAALLALSL